MKLTPLLCPLAAGLSIFLIVLFFCFSAKAEVKELVYDGKEIDLYVKKDHITTVIFPEPVNQVIRGFGADSYIVRRKDKQPHTLELMPTVLEKAEMTISGISGENYVLRFWPKDDFYTKVTILRIVTTVDKTEHLDGGKSKIVLDDAPYNKEAPGGLAPNLNLKMTLKGNNLPLKIYFSTIAQVTGYNVITTPDIDSQKTSINLEHIEVWRALKSLLYKFGYGFKVSQEDLIITDTQTRIFNITIPAADQSFSDETSNQSYTNNMNNNNVQSSLNQQNQQVNVGSKMYYKNSSPRLSLWTDIENNIQALITPKEGRYSINKVSGSIIVTDKPQILDKIADWVATINENLSRQQGFEIQIVSVTLSRDHETGIDWNEIVKGVAGLNNITASTNFTQAGFLSGQLLSLSATGPQVNSGTQRAGVSLLLKALDSMGQVNIISRPSITVTNMFPAIIQEVTSIPYISGTGQTLGNNITTSNVTTSQVSDGLTMRLVAKIEQKRTILNIAAAVNTLESMINVPAGNGLTIQEPKVSTKSITTNVGVEPGKTLILGGLISTTQNKSHQGIPYLEKIPLLGSAFQYRAQSAQKTELVIMITPRSITA